MTMTVTIPSQTMVPEDLFNRGTGKVRTVMCALFGDFVTDNDRGSLAAVLEEALKDFENVRPAVQEANR